MRPFPQRRPASPSYVRPELIDPDLLDAMTKSAEAEIGRVARVGISLINEETFLRVWPFI
jgi:hypothetical protein